MIEFVGYRFHISYDLVIIQVVRDQDTTFASDHPTIATLFATYSANDIARSNYGPQSKTLRKLFLGKMISNASLDACYGLRKQEVKNTIRDIYKTTTEKIEQIMCRQDDK